MSFSCVFLFQLEERFREEGENEELKNNGDLTVYSYSSRNRAHEVCYNASIDIRFIHLLFHVVEIFTMFIGANP